jgi:hypothetical protein
MSLSNYSGTNTDIQVIKRSGNATEQLQKFSEGVDDLDFSNNATANGLNEQSANGSESTGWIDCEGKSNIVLKVEFSTAGASASFALKLRDHNATPMTLMTAEQFSGIVSNASGATTDVKKASHRHGNFLRFENKVGAKDFKVVLVDASQLQAGTVSVWAHAV